MTERKGIVGEKLGMTQVFVETRAVPVTVIKAGPNVVAQIRTQDADGYDAVQLAYGQVAPRHVNKPSKGHFDKAGAEPQRHLVELRTDDAGGYELGQTITADVFAPGDMVDVVGVSKGRGTSGVMRRHNFKGQRATHGVKKVHRHPGSIGQHTDPSRVWKGKRMAGQYGNTRSTMRNLLVHQIDKDSHMLLVRGAVPGARNGYVMIRKAD